ncbi:MAG: cation:proton antiporter [Bacteroidota bacterium]
MVLAASIPFLNEIVALFAVSVGMAYLCYKLRLVPIAGFLLAGVLIGPNALGLVYEQELVDVLAEIGVILLLFTIGVEFSLEKLSRIGRAIFIGGGTQVFVTIGLVTGILALAGIGWQAGVYTGCLVALSSTAIVLALLAERAETDTPAGKLSLAVLIFQDLAIVAMVLLVPMLAGTGGGPLDLLIVLGKAAALILAVIVLARRVVPWVLEKVVRTRRPELFLLTIVAICFGTAAVSAMADVSLALGAFLAGLIVSESEYSEQALSEILPLRTVFNAVFFVSVGMLLDLRFVLGNPLLVLGVAAAVVVLKFVITTGAILVLGYPIRIAAATGLALAQIGEFSFVLERAGRAAGITPAGLGDAGAQTFIAVTVLLMIATPFQVQAAPRFGTFMARTPLRKLGDGPGPDAVKPASEDGAHGVDVHAMEDHVVVVGYGPAGQRLVQVMQDVGIPFVVIELNPESTARLRKEGVPVIYGDASRAFLLEHAGIARAKLGVILINDPTAVPRILQQMRYLNPTLQLIARTRFLRTVEPLQKAGADIVVPEEMETTVRVFSHVLGAYLVPPAEIDRLVREIRQEDYRILRGSIQEAHLMVLQGLDEEGLHTRAVALRNGAPAAGQTLAELDLRRCHEITVIAVRRGGRTLANPAGDFQVEAGDRLVLIGSAEHFAEAATLFRAPMPSDG